MVIPLIMYLVSLVQNATKKNMTHSLFFFFSVPLVCKWVLDCGSVTRKPSIVSDSKI